jgi:hypothetical protein
MNPVPNYQVKSTGVGLGADFAVDTAGGVDPFGEGRVDVDGGGEFGVGGAAGHRDDGLMDQVAGIGTGDVAAQDAIGLRVGDEDATIWPTISGGCHLARETEAALEDGGFRIERVERFVFSVSALDPPKSHILGIARRV